ncbi:Uncharacterised protein [Mycobacteroides abscessus subsp. abscessus]|nr:Uncharacterised protein [Mycobacteroides abscessus subsp. abscessus]
MEKSQVRVGKSQVRVEKSQVKVQNPQTSPQKSQIIPKTRQYLPTPLSKTPKLILLFTIKLTGKHAFFFKKPYNT